MDDSEPAPDTLRSCEACGGDADDCTWCDGGYQTEKQLHHWWKFRKRMKHISGTYGFLDTSVKDILGRLKERNTNDAIKLHQEGQALLDAWENADPSAGGRDRHTDRLLDYQRRVLDYLTKTPHWWSNRP